MGRAGEMFLLVAIFQGVAQKRPQPQGTAERSRWLDRFITQKIVAVGPSSLLPAMAAYYIGLFVLAIGRTLLARHPVAGLRWFDNNLFTMMIFTDVLTLILSPVVSGQYEMVFRNAAFVVFDYSDPVFARGGTPVWGSAGGVGDGVWDTYAAGVQPAYEGAAG